MYVVTPRCMYALLLLLLLWCSDERMYTYPYSMMHRRLTTAGTEAAPQYRQLLVTTPCLLSPFAYLCAQPTTATHHFCCSGCAAGIVLVLSTWYVVTDPVF